MFQVQVVGEWSPEIEGVQVGASGVRWPYAVRGADDRVQRQLDRLEAGARIFVLGSFHIDEITATKVVEL